MWLEAKWSLGVNRWQMMLGVRGGCHKRCSVVRGMQEGSVVKVFLKLLVIKSNLGINTEGY